MAPLSSDSGVPALPKNADAVPGRWNAPGGAICLFSVIICAYLPAMRAGYVWDDDDYVYQNSNIPAADGLWHIWFTSDNPQYYPLVFTTYWLEYRLWDWHPAGYHITNILLHALNAFLVWRVLLQLRIRGAFWIALIFGLHTVHVESVAWITERKNVLSGCFYLCALLAFLRWEQDPRRRWYSMSLGCFLLGLFAKTVICTLPAALLIIRWMRFRPLDRRFLASLIPFVLLGAVMGTVTALFEHYFVIYGADDQHWKLSVAERMIVAGRALWFYAGKLLWPCPLVFNYPRWSISAGDVWQWLWPASAAIVGAGVLIWHARVGRRVAAGLWYMVITVAPALGFVNVAPMRFSFAADHFQYLSSIGLIAVMVGCGRRLSEWVILCGGTRGTAGSRAVMNSIAGAVTCLVLGVLTFQRCFAYENAATLWRDTVRHNPTSWLARINLGVWLREQGEATEAAEHFRFVIDHGPAWPEPQAAAHTNLGHLARQQAAWDLSIRHYREALAWMPRKEEALFSLALAQYAAGRFGEAIDAYTQYLGRNPADGLAHFNLGLALEADSQVQGAESHFRDAIRLAPHLVEPYRRLAELLLKEGRREDAKAVLDEGLRRHPESPELRALRER